MSKSDLVLDYLLKASDLKVDPITLQQICKITEKSWDVNSQDMFNASYKYIINGILPRSRVLVNYDYQTTQLYNRAVLLHSPTTFLVISEKDKYIDGKVLKIHPCINKITKTLYTKPKYTNNRVVFFKQSCKFFIQGDSITKTNPYSIKDASNFFTTVHTFCVKNNKDISKKLEIVKDSLDVVGLPTIRKINNSFWDDNPTLLKISLDTIPHRVSRKNNNIAVSLVRNLIKKAQYYFRKNKSLMEILFKNTSFNEEQQIQLLLFIASKPNLRIKKVNKHMCIILNKNNNTPLNDVVEIIKNEL